MSAVRPLTLSFTSLLLAQAVIAGGPPHPAMAFDQVDRVLLHGEGPPEGDTFAADAAEIASLPPLDAHAPGPGKLMARGAGNMLVSSALGLIPIAGPFIAGASSRAMNAAQQAAQQREWDRVREASWRVFSAGTLSHFAFYGVWVRREVKSQITVLKPDQGITLAWDSARKTVQTVHTEDSMMIDLTGGLHAALVSQPAVERLADSTRAGVAVHVYRTTGAIELKHALNWCTGGRHNVVQLECVAALSDPQPSSTAPPAGGLGDACDPSSTSSYREPGQLVLYRATTVDANSPQGITLLFERGNLRNLDEHDSSLFEAPADFTKE